MTRRVRLWIAAVLAIAATGLMVGLAITAALGVNQGHIHLPAADRHGDTS